MNREHVIWAGALQIEKRFGNDGCLFIFDRIETLKVEDDINGVTMWQRIGDAYGRLAPAICTLH